MNISDFELGEVLNREQLKTISGGDRIRNIQGTGNYYMSGGTAVGCECTYEIRKWFLGSWQQVTGPCPAGSEEYSCVN